MATTTHPTKRPSGLAKTIEAEVLAKQKRLADQARADIALIRRRRSEIGEAFYDIGEALVRLRRPGVAQAAGHPNFVSLCQGELDISPARAYQLVDIVTRVSREDATRIGQERTRALLALGEATPERETPAGLEHATVTLPGGDELVVPEASTREIFEAARLLREQHANGGRGRHVTRAERTKTAALKKDLRAAGIHGAEVRAVAPHAGGGAHFVLRAPLEQLALVARVLAKRAKA